jgi:hypothetical protein
VAVVPDTHDFGSGVGSSTEANAYIRDPIRFLLNPPLARLRSGAAQSLTNSTWTSLNLNTEEVDKDPSGAGGHDNVTNNSRFTAVYAGWYRVSGKAGIWPANTTGRRGVRYAVNGVAVIASKILLQGAASSAGDTPCASTLLFLNVGDYVEVQGFQESGGALNCGSATVDDNTHLTVKWESN